MAYSSKVIEHYNNPRNMGSFPKDEKNVGTGIVGAPECGDVMKLQIKVEGERIVDAKFKTFGCGSAIASSSLATEWMKGKTLAEAEKIKNTEIVQELSLPPVKIHCSVLAEDAIKAAIADYRPNTLTAYLYDLAQRFSSFYNNCPVLDAGPSKRPTRLLLCDLTARTIRHGLGLLGIAVVEAM